MSTEADTDGVGGTEAAKKSNAGISQREVRDGAFSSYSDAELEQLLSDIRRLDEDSFIGAAHSAAVKD